MHTARLIILTLNTLCWVNVYLIHNECMACSVWIVLSYCGCVVHSFIRSSRRDARHSKLWSLATIMTTYMWMSPAGNTRKISFRLRVILRRTSANRPIVQWAFVCRPIQCSVLFSPDTIHKYAWIQSCYENKRFAIISTKCCLFYTFIGWINQTQHIE